MVTSLKSWFHYATTDAQFLGILTWVGLLVTVGGFWIAIAQIRKVKRASQAANEAVSKLTSVVRSQEQAAKVSAALQHLTSAQAMMRQNNSDAAAAHLSVGWTALISARELTDTSTEHEQISLYITSTRRLLDDVMAPNAIALPPPRISAQRHKEISGVLSGLGVLSARL